MLRMSGLLLTLERLDQQPPNLLRVLCYHRIDEPGSKSYLDPDVLSATPSEFAKQLRFISRNYRVISVEQLIAAIGGGPVLPPRAVLLTFDDGYRDFVENAWPTLKSMGLPVVLFVSTAYLDNALLLFWWDALYQMVTRTQVQEIQVNGLDSLKLDGETARRGAFGRLKAYLFGLGIAEREQCLAQLQRCTGITPERRDSLLTWEDLVEMSSEGLDIAPHTHTHSVMARLSLEQMASEVQTSKEHIRRQLGQEWPVFCYPNGKPGTFSRDTRRVLQDSGYVGAFTTVWGPSILGRTDPMEMRRIGVSWRLSLDPLRYQLTGHYWAQRKRAGRW